MAYEKDEIEIHDQLCECGEHEASAASAGYRLLVARFRNMATTREEHAAKLRNDGNSSFVSVEAAAAAYHRCADELLTCLEGNTPPPVGEQWVEAEGKESSR